MIFKHAVKTSFLNNKLDGLEKGHKEAALAGQQLAKEGFTFDVAFTSFLKRAIRTCWHTLEATDSMNAPINQAWQLNERCLQFSNYFLKIDYFIVYYIILYYTDTMVHFKD